MDNNNTNNNKPNNKVNMPKFNLNWLYMIIALMLLGLWWSSDSRGSGSKLVPYSDFQKYVTNGYISKVLGSEKTLEALSLIHIYFHMNVSSSTNRLTIF